MDLVYPFTIDETPALAQVGGKAMSLVFMTRQGLPVPPGFVLSVAFFEPWLERVRNSPEWAQVLDSSPEDLKRRCNAVKALVMGFELDTARREALAEALASLKVDGETPLLAVRSSAPEEDLEEASFAGGYVTVLGVEAENVEDAVRHSFASCLDERVFLYKQAHGFAVEEPSIAVIVQQQVPAETSGVAFSLNPINNCYDEAVINANFGLGESVVSGRVSPDAFVVDKVSRTILEKKVGKKETSIWLDADGGTYEEPAPSRARLCLSDEQVLALTDMLVAVEEDYKKLIDMEWALAGGKLYLLQTRPITAYFLLPEDLRTAPGKPKRLYADLTLLKWGMQEPLSVMGTDHLAIMNSESLKLSMGDISPETVNAIRRTLEGRTYLVISNVMRMQGQERYASEFREMDALGAEIIASIDETEYPPDESFALRRILFNMIRQNIGTGWRLLQAFRNPLGYKQKYLEEEERFRRVLAAEMGVDEELPLAEFAMRNMTRMLSYAQVFIPMIFVFMLARSRIKRLFEDDAPEIRDQVTYLDRALPQNVTIQMGLAMYHLARFAEIGECASGDEFASRLAERAFSPAFLEAWDAFMERFGFRAPMEMDPAVPRFREQPARFYEQLRAMAGPQGTDAERNPQAIYDQARARREEAYQALLQAAREKGKRKAKRFESNYRILIELGGYRESSKYYVALITDVFRRHVLALAQPLVEAGRLDQPQQAFDLTMDDLERGLADPSVDLRALAEKNTHYLSRFQRVREFPHIIDSRGKILRAPKKEAGEGELLGEPISAGTVQGEVKVLHRPDEKPVLPGEILVARATDPGWTPLFLNAGGIVLEVGGALQHGALVAREYGKPCVAGIENATSILTDGQVIELDGANGIVRLGLAGR